MPAHTMRTPRVRQSPMPYILGVVAVMVSLGYLVQALSV